MNLGFLHNLKASPAQYAEADPFPHIVIDDFLEPYDAETLWSEFPKVTPDWLNYDTYFERKFANDRFEHLPKHHRNALLNFNGGPFVSFLETLTGIPGLIGDPHFRGGGLHSIPFEGFLDIHADMQLHPRLGLYRRVNLLLYLNKDFKSSYQGELEFWDKDMRSCVKKIEPKFNRAVIFNTDAKSYHGHPTKWMNGMCHRESMAVYYWSAAKPDGEINLESTKFQKRPCDKFDALKEEARAKRNLGRLQTKDEYAK